MKDQYLGRNLKRKRLTIIIANLSNFLKSHA